MWPKSSPHVWKQKCSVALGTDFSVAFICSALLECAPGILSKYKFTDFNMPVAGISQKEAWNYCSVPDM